DSWQVFFFYKNKSARLCTFTLHNSVLLFCTIHCCGKIEQTDTKLFVKHIQKGRKEATNKVEILQKSVHYFDVTMSNDDIQVMFKNLAVYLEHVFDKILEEEYTASIR
ncbi:hypothetical protein J2S07_004329, partial [Robertmurraya andreesenii]|nr:hypothetical protein [Robertmurraya andreesenii]